MWVDLASGQIQIAVGSHQSFATVASRGVKPIAVTGKWPSAGTEGKQAQRQLNVTLQRLEHLGSATVEGPFDALGSCVIDRNLV